MLAFLRLLPPLRGWCVRFARLSHGLTPTATPGRPYGTLTTAKLGDEPFFLLIVTIGPRVWQTSHEPPPKHNLSDLSHP